ncbi:acyltransferase family protein [Pseudomonas sp. AU12215]|uniref:acyltransferase family protein n=1 Tax=Pseudomonas sp. AU12215 TaxID=1860123 RepID=UPI00350E4A9C
MAAASTRNQWLDICRSLAISLVLLSHGRHFLTPAFPAAQNFKFGGFLGVELFFVLSGFLIGGAVAEAECNTVTGLKQVHHAATPLPLS